MAMGKSFPEHYKIVALQVHQYENRQLKGTLHWPNFKVAIRGYMELLLLLEEGMDQLGFPQRTTEPRHFKAIEKRRLENAVSLPKRPSEGNLPVIANFTIKVMFRQHSSWQGVLGWREGKEEAPFRSVWKLLLLIDEVLRDNMNKEQIDLTSACSLQEETV